jgi:hypothetical protein
MSERFPAGGHIEVLQGTPRPTTLVPVKDLGSPHVVQHPLQLCVCAQVEEHQSSRVPLLPNCLALVDNLGLILNEKDLGGQGTGNRCLYTRAAFRDINQLRFG